MIPTVIAFVVGLLMGTGIGLFALALCIASKEDDDENS